MINKGFTSHLSQKGGTKSIGKGAGFTILEVILAIFILTIAVFASFALIQQTIIGASLNQSKLIAYYLAQEGIENVRNIRDTNWLQEKNWQENIFSKTETIGNFKREVVVSEKDNYLEVKVIVGWNERGGAYDIETINHLYNWLYD